MNRPATITIAVVLQWIAAVVAALLGLELMTAALQLARADTEGAIGAAVKAQGITDVPATMIVLGVFMAGALVLAIAILRVVLAVYLARGRGWARTIITILVALNLIAGVSYLFQAEWLRGVGVIVLELIVLWLLFNPAANAYVAARSDRSGAPAAA